MYTINEISGNIVDLQNSLIYPGTLYISNSRIREITRDKGNYDTFIVPGLVDAHVHIESSMLVPSEFARLSVVHGTVAAVSDPHEIANVLGTGGVDYMIDNSRNVPFKFYFGAPSCVPATDFETSGAVVGADEVERLLIRDEIKYLSEVMNFPGVIAKDPVLTAKLAAAKKYNKQIDGHAPGLRGEALKQYVSAGITTDHESLSHEEAEEKLSLGMKILIREGSAARNLDELIGLIRLSPDQCMFCSDDMHPDDLLKGHIDSHVRRAIKRGYSIFDILRCASLNPVRHYGLGVGLLRQGDYADFVVIDNLADFKILKTCINGEVVAEHGRCLIKKTSPRVINRFAVQKKSPGDFRVRQAGNRIKVIEVTDGLLTTGRTRERPSINDGFVVSDVSRDILKLAVVNRYFDAAPSVAFVRNFGLKKGAIASSVAHDSHNIVAVGVTDKEISRAVNLVIENRGGLSVVCDSFEDSLALPVAGLMSDEDGYEVANKYAVVGRLARGLGSGLRAPFMTLSFMALLVIPSLKLSDKGLFDAEQFEFTSLFE